MISTQALATLGLALYELACKSEGKAAADARLWGSLLAFLGSVGHSGMFVMAEHALENKSAKAAGLTPFRLSSCMGFAETMVLGTFVALQITYDAEQMTTVAVAYAPLILIDGLHALSFFATLGERGAVGAWRSHCHAAEQDRLQTLQAPPYSRTRPLFPVRDSRGGRRSSPKTGSPSARPC